MIFEVIFCHYTDSFLFYLLLCLIKHKMVFGGFQIQFCLLLQEIEINVDCGIVDCDMPCCCK
jgi:hypothetical protein